MTDAYAKRATCARGGGGKHMAAGGRAGGGVLRPSPAPCCPSARQADPGTRRCGARSPKTARGGVAASPFYAARRMRGRPRPQEAHGSSRARGGAGSARREGEVRCVPHTTQLQPPPHSPCPLLFRATGETNLQTHIDRRSRADQRSDRSISDPATNQRQGRPLVNFNSSPATIAAAGEKVICTEKGRLAAASPPPGWREAAYTYLISMEICAVVVVAAAAASIRIARAEQQWTEKAEPPWK